LLDKILRFIYRRPKLVDTKGKLILHHVYVFKLNKCYNKKREKSNLRGNFKILY